MTPKTLIAAFAAAAMVFTAAVPAAQAAPVKSTPVTKATCKLPKVWQVLKVKNAKTGAVTSKGSCRVKAKATAKNCKAPNKLVKGTRFDKKTGKKIAVTSCRTATGKKVLVCPAGYKVTTKVNKATKKSVKVCTLAPKKK